LARGLGPEEGKEEAQTTTARAKKNGSGGTWILNLPRGIEAFFNNIIYENVLQSWTMNLGGARTSTSSREDRPKWYFLGSEK
jgi:hypothetical protein